MNIRLNRGGASPAGWALNRCRATILFVLLALVLASTLPALHAQAPAKASDAGAKTAPAKKADAAAAKTGAAKYNVIYTEHKLKNGLRVILAEDHSAPTYSISVTYNVGSRDERPGRTGFAHLFEHMMFQGSENIGKGEHFLLVFNNGGNMNGTTNADRTNYFENVPTPALERTLFLEADRMGNLLPAVTQEKLDNQRGVVQNEKRQGDNQPYGLFFYAMLQGLYPEAHPYHHSTIGSMADLDAASLDDARNWFRGYYGPNNAVLVLAGDIDVATARPLVEKYFGAIARGPAVPEPQGGVPERSAESRTVMNDRVANPRIYFTWAAPGRLAPDYVGLSIAMTILAGGESSRLHNALVRDEQLAVAVAGQTIEWQISSAPLLIVDVKPGVDPARAEARTRELLAQFLAEGPTADELQRVATRTVAGTIRGLEQIGGFGGKAATLAEGVLYANDAAFYKKRLAAYAAATPASVRDAARRWLNDGAHLIVVQPGERGPAELALAGVASARPAAATSPTSHTPDRSKLPAVGSERALTFPAVERATLSNGAKVTFARSAAVPVVTVRALFDAGAAADDRQKPGLQRLTQVVMREGTTTRTGKQIGEEAERLGAQLSYGFGADSTDFTVVALKPNLAPSLALLADVARNPAFPQAELDRLRSIQLALIAQEENSPNGLASRAIQPLIFGADHPYGLPSGLGTRDGVRSVTREDLGAFHRRWIRPDNMQLFVVGDGRLAELMPQLEAAFGAWRAPADARGAKRFTAPAPQGQGRILLIDRPNSPQSVIVAGMPIGLKGPDDPLALRAANTVLGGSFTSRFNSDLRETKGWSYGAGSGVSSALHDLVFTINAPVQADRTGDSIEALKQNITAFQSDRVVTAEELQRAINNNTLSLPGNFETSGAVLNAIQTNAVLGRPDTYQTTLATRYRAVDRDAATAAVKRAVDPAKLSWVVVGDASVVEPQLARLGMPVEVRRAAPATPAR